MSNDSLASIAIQLPAFSDMTKTDLVQTSVENPMNIHRMECAETPVFSWSGISIQLSYSASTGVFQRVNAAVTY